MEINFSSSEQNHQTIDKDTAIELCKSMVQQIEKSLKRNQGFSSTDNYKARGQEQKLQKVVSLLEQISQKASKVANSPKYDTVDMGQFNLQQINQCITQYNDSYKPQNCSIVPNKNLQGRFYAKIQSQDSGLRRLHSEELRKFIAEEYIFEQVIDDGLSEDQYQYFQLAEAKKKLSDFLGQSIQGVSAFDFRFTNGIGCVLINETKKQCLNIKPIFQDMKASLSTDQQNFKGLLDIEKDKINGTDLTLVDKATKKYCVILTKLCENSTIEFGSLKEQIYKVSGSKQDCLDCKKYLEEKLMCRFSETMNFPTELTLDILNKMKEKFVDIEKHNKVTILQKDKKVLVVASIKRMGDIKKAMEDLKKLETNLYTNFIMSSKTLPINSIILGRTLKKDKEIVSKLDNIKVKIRVEDNSQAILSGPKNIIDQATIIFNQHVTMLSNKIVTEFITNATKINVAQTCSQALNNFNVDFDFVFQQDQPNANQAAAINFQQRQAERDWAQWYYPVTSQDANYKQRDDKMNNRTKYDSDQNSQIELHYKDCISGKIPFGKRLTIIGDQQFQQNGFQYEVWGDSADSQTWKQANKETKKERVLHREECKYVGQEQVVMMQGLNEEQKQDGSNLGNRPQLKLLGLKEDIDQFKKELNKLILDPNNIQEYLFINKSVKDSFIKELIDHCKSKFKVTMLIARGRISLKGIQALKAKEKVQQFLDEYWKHEFPEYWENLIALFDTKQYQLTNLNQNHAQWQQIQANIQTTLPAAQLVKVEVVQNYAQWIMFKQQISILHNQYGQTPERQLLWHGTRENNPMNLCQYNQGFDMRYSRDGMWGHANYFAVNSSYSNAYAHPVPNTNNKQMFLAEIITGKSIQLNPSKGLQKPPQQPNCNYDYDSVKGHTGGSDVYMTYLNTYSYPAFLVTYTGA